MRFPDFSLDTVLRHRGITCCDQSFGTVKSTGCNAKRIYNLTSVASEQAKSGCELAFLGIPGHPVTRPLIARTQAPRVRQIGYHTIIRY